MRRLILILGDQLSPSLSALADLDPQADIVLMAEVAEEAQYVPHHKQKIALLLSAMRHFADDLRARGVTVVALLDGRPAVRELLYERHTIIIILSSLVSGYYSALLHTTAGSLSMPLQSPH